MEQIPTYISLIKQHAPSWAPLADTHFHFKKLAGLTNITYQVTAPDHPLKPLVFHRFAKVEGLIDRETENAIFEKASLIGVGPKLIYVDESHRIQQFLDGCFHPEGHELLSEDGFENMTDVMSRLHSIRIHQIANDEPLADYMLSESYVINAKKKMTCHLFTSEQLKSVSAIQALLKPEMLQEIRRLLKINRKDSLRLCHNDLNNLNIMVSKSTAEYRLIDYEYARYNYKAYDIANFLNEACIDYTWPTHPAFRIRDDLRPSKTSLSSFCKKYLQKQWKLRNGTQSIPQISVIDSEVQILCEEVLKCLALCNYYWAIWSVMTYKPTEGFDYLEHGLARLSLFCSYFNLLRGENPVLSY